MSMVVDTCVIIDVLDNRSPFSIASAKVLDKHADVMIGALASVNDGLITRNAKDFRALFPKLHIDTP